MTHRCILQIALLLCFSTTALSTSYRLLQFQQRSSSLACQKLLLQLLQLPGMPQHCLEERMDFKVPDEIKQPQQFQKEDAVLVIYEMLQQIFCILRRNFSSTGWTETISEKNLLAEVSRQMDRLETILGEIMEKENFTGVNMTILHLKKYYLQIVQYLKSKEYSNCAWTVVRVEILRNFSFLNHLTDYLHN
ncbi:interferon beta [Mesoplodon densirostris]|uniref:interferon beta n=1 Tax=Mesoplodon densirostris TaxID=48708 RepID=UPI0028DD1C0B|nr:interferon beta [Mesoplodon densirostris]